jgi:hypothetical protein
MILFITNLIVVVLSTYLGFKITIWQAILLGFIFYILIGSNLSKNSELRLMREWQAKIAMCKIRHNTILHGFRKLIVVLLIFSSLNSLIIAIIGLFFNSTYFGKLLLLSWCFFCFSAKFQNGRLLIEEISQLQKFKAYELNENEYIEYVINNYNHFIKLATTGKTKWSLSKEKVHYWIKFNFIDHFTDDETPYSCDSIEEVGRKWFKKIFPYI